MSAENEYDDDYVARLLAEDAKKTSARYVKQGLSAFLPKARSADAPKPNTRFLSHIVREADQHNAALKRKEELEARARLNDLKRERSGHKRARREDESHDRKRQRFLNDLTSAARSRHRVSKHTDKSDKDRRRHEHPRHHRRRSHSPERITDRRPRQPRSRAAEEDESQSTPARRHSSASDSDPVDDYIQAGSKSPASAPVRGRGTRNVASGMDKHFAEDYDPSTDIHSDLDEAEGDDWDMALEAFRDRAKWKQNQKSRLREAGFDDEQITKWEKGTTADSKRDGDVRDVRWSKQGERREWDIGKIPG